MKNILKVSFVILFISPLAFSEEAPFAKLNDYKKVQLQFSKPLSLELSDFVKEPGKGATPDTRAPNYRLLHASAALLGPEEGEIRASCKVYEKTMLSNRTKNYAAESVKLDKMITEKSPIVLNQAEMWTITKISPNDLGALIWLQSEAGKIQIDCEKKTTKGEEKALLPEDIFTTLALSEVRFFKDGKEIKPNFKKEPDSAPASSDVSSP